MRRSLIALALLLITTAASAEAPNPDVLAKHAIDVQTGPAWDKVRYFAFTFDVDRNGKRLVSFPQRWDRFTGDYRVSGKDQQDRDFVVILNTNTKQGKAWINGAPAAGQDLQDMLNLGYRRFINDTYWLLMPIKMLDPGVHRAYEGQKTDNGHTYDVVKLWFDPGVGLTPADQYWAWIKRDSGVVEQWHMKLQNTKPEDPPVAVVFHDFKKIGGVSFSTRREVVGKNQTVSLDDVTVANEVPKDAFAEPH
jgi:hypothetical protein